MENNMLGKITIYLLANILFARGDHWGYLPEQANGVILKGDEGWGGQCSLGRRQSPIDLAEDAAVLGKYAPLKFDNYGDILQNAKVRNTGHSLQIDVLDGQEYILSGGGLPGAYVMDQMHFHWSSEHTINGHRNGLELHIVSHNKLYQNFSTAVKNKKGIAVLGIFFHVGGEHNYVLKNILDSAEPVKDGVGEASLIKNPFAPIDLLPKDRSKYFRYEGSLTTPTCEEAVLWTIMAESVPFAIAQIERFKQVKDDHGKYLTHNFRQLQRLNSRPLVFVTEENNYHSAAPTLHATFLLSTAIIVQIARSIF